MPAEPLLSIESLRVEYATARGYVTALDGVSLDVHAGEMLGLAGESGSGKSTLAHAILRTLRPPAVITGGHVWFNGEDVLSFDVPRLMRFRWKAVSMVFQSAMSSLNPVLTIGAQMVDVMLAHSAQPRGDTRGKRSKAVQRAGELLALVGIDTVHLESYPHQLSGGMRQRVGIALALALEPRLIILDEPTTALDVVVQASIIHQLTELQAQLGFAVLFITHDLPLLFECTDRIAVLYGGRLAELGPTVQVRTQPFHPYTAGLMRSSPTLDGPRHALTGIDGAPPRLDQLPSGCFFHPRCPAASEQCRTAAPTLTTLSPGRAVACYHPEGAP